MQIHQLKVENYSLIILLNKYRNNNNLKKFLSKFEETKWLEYLSDFLCGSN